MHTMPGGEAAVSFLLFPYMEVDFVCCLRKEGKKHGAAHCRDRWTPKRGKIYAV